MKKYKDLGVDPSIRFISGDSEEAKEIFRKLGWYDRAPKKDTKSSDDFCQFSFWALFVLLFTWISCTLLNEPTRTFISTYIAWFNFFKYFKDRRSILPPSSS